MVDWVQNRQQQLSLSLHAFETTPGSATTDLLLKRFFTWLPPALHPTGAGLPPVLPGISLPPLATTTPPSLVVRGATALSPVSCEEVRFIKVRPSPPILKGLALGINPQSGDEGK